MAWENVICSKCKEEYRIQMYGPYKTREWKIANWSGICDTCKEKEVAEMVKQNKSGKSPELTGSDKQIAWAINIREKFKESYDHCDYSYCVNHFAKYLKNYYKSFLSISKLEKKMEKLKETMDEKKLKELMDIAADNFFEIPSAHEWIENRQVNIEKLVGKTMAEIFTSIQTPATNFEKDIQADVEAEAVMEPSDPVSTTIADIKLNDDKIIISFLEKNNDFKKIIKNYNFRWDSPWKKQLSFMTENPEDRMAEIGHTLLAAGFCIRILNPEIRKKIITENFILEHTRWISVLSNKPTHFYIQWAYEDNMYSEAKKITGSRYDKPGVIIPMEHMDEILDFAKIYEFKFSPAAETLLKKAKANKKAALILKSENLKTKEKQLPESNSDIPVLEVPKKIEVDDELKD